MISSLLLPSLALVAALAENGATPHAEESAEATDPLSTALKTLIGSLQQHYGIWGILAAAVVLVWWHWSKIKELPGVEPFVRLLKDRAVRLKRRVASSIGNEPRDNDRFTIAVARLIDDNEKGDFKALVVEELKTFSSIAIMDIDSEVSDRNVKAGHNSARTIMSTRRADALIWGRVRQLEGRNRVPKLYLTASPNDALNKVGSYIPTEDLKLPDLFWDDLKEILGLVVATATAKFDALSGHYTADQLVPHIKRVRHLLDTQSTWTQQRRAPIQYSLASALLSLGEQSGGQRVSHRGH